MESSSRVVIIGSNVVLRSGVAALLKEQPDIEVVAMMVGNEEVVWEKVREAQPCFILIGLKDRLEDKQLIDDATLIPNCRVVVFSNVVHGWMSFLKKGVVGILITNEMDTESLPAALRALKAGNSVLLPREAVPQMSSNKNGHSSNSDDMKHDPFTPREFEVLTLLVEGMSNREIAGQMGIAEITVKKYITTIIDKLGARDRTQVAVIAIRRGLVE